MRILGFWNTYFRIVGALLICALSSTLHVNAADDPITIEILVDNNYPPISFVENGEAAGLNAELLRLLNKRMPGYKIVPVPMNWDQALNRIKSGASVAIMGTFNTGSLRPYMYPYSSAIYAESVVVICGDQVELIEPVSWPSSFGGKLMLNVAGYDGWLNNQVRHRRFTKLMNFLEVPNVEIAAKMVDAGNADCSLFERNVLANMNAQRAPDDQLNVNIVSSVQRSTVHLGFSLAAWQKPEHAYLFDFAKSFDFALIDFRLEGELDKLFQKYHRIE